MFRRALAGGRVTTPGFDDDAVVLTANPQRVFDFAFDDPLDPNFTQDPGFHALSTGFAASNGLLASGLTNGDKLTFDVLSGLQYWNGTGAVSIGNVPAGETLQLALGSASRTIGTGTGSFAGFIIGTIGNANDGDQGLHVHLGSTLVAGTNPQPANGVYFVRDGSENAGHRWRDARPKHRRVAAVLCAVRSQRAEWSDRQRGRLCPN